MWSVVGHEETVRLLDRALHAGRLAHSYLLVGPPQVGKMAMARQLAAAVNCLGDKPPCGVCAQCQRTLDGRHADLLVLAVVEAEGRRAIGIDAVRDASRQAHLKPYEGSNRVFIVDGAEGLSDEAANAMLKLLEEPPPQLLLLLLAVDAARVIPTIRSRCQRLELRPLPEGRVAEALESVWGAPPERAAALARLSRGRMGWAVTAWQDPEVMEARGRRLERMAEVLEGGLLERFSYAGELAALMPQQRGALWETLDLWATWWHDMLAVNEGVPKAALDRDMASKLEGQRGQYGRREIAQALGAVLRSAEVLAMNANPRLALEEMVLAFPEAPGGSRQGGVRLTGGAGD